MDNQLSTVWTATVWRELGDQVPFDGKRHPRDWRELRRVHQRAATLLRACHQMGQTPPDHLVAFVNGVQAYVTVTYNLTV